MGRYPLVVSTTCSHSLLCSVRIDISKGRHFLSLCCVCERAIHLIPLRLSPASQDTNARGGVVHYQVVRPYNERVRGRHFHRVEQTPTATTDATGPHDVEHQPNTGHAHHKRNLRGRLSSNDLT